MTVTALQTTTATPAAKTTKSGAGNALNSDFDTFLKMLTTQLQNQDPLDPIDNSEYAVQLATFSGVEQQVKTNDLLEGLGGQLGVMGMADLASWVGKQARADMPVWFDGTALSVTATPDNRADAAELVASDSSGKIVARDPVALGSDSFDWTGMTAAGTALPVGRYTLTLESSAKGAVIASTPVETYAEVVEARLADGKTTLVFPGGIEVESGKITALRND